MSYEALRQFVDSWGLAATMLLFVILCGWPFLPRARAGNQRAATMILENEDETNG